MTGVQEAKGDPTSMMSAAEKADLEEAKARMSPEQRAQTEAIMKQSATPAKAMIEKRVCLTKENINQILTFFAGKNSVEKDKSTCRITPVKSTATVMESQEVCSSKNEATSNSTLLFEAPHPETLTARVESSVGSLEMKIKVIGKWLGPACGDVKP